MDDIFYPPDHIFAHGLLLCLRRHIIEEVMDLFMEPAKKKKIANSHFYLITVEQDQV